MNDQTIPLVSICSITYNHAPFIRQCLDGMLMQQCNFDYEIIINDDCSTDGTTEIIREYQEKYPDIIHPIYHEENEYSKGVRGMCAKYVFPKARGKYIALCEGDDYWTDPLKLQKQVNFMESHPDYSMCFHQAIMHWENGELPDQIFSELEDREYAGTELYENWIVPTASILIRREVINSPIYNKAVSSGKFCYGDILVFLSAAAQGKVRAMNDTMSVYRRQSGGISYRRNIKQNLALIRHQQNISTYFGKRYKKNSNEIVKRSFRSLIRISFQDRNYYTALIYFTNYLIRQPLNAVKYFMFAFFHVKKYIK